MATQIVVVDDHKIMRDGLRTLFEKEPGMDVIAEAGTGREAVHLARKLKPQVVLMDVSMADLNGIEATRLIKKICPQTKVIALSIHSDKRFIMGMFRAGASGYILKDCAFCELVQAVKAVLQEKTYLCSKISEGMLRDLLEAAPVEAGAQALTPREREILQLLAEGKTTKVIASLLHLSQKTIETHRQHIMEKLNIFSIAELTKFAVREGITPP